MIFIYKRIKKKIITGIYYMDFRLILNLIKLVYDHLI